MRRKSNIHPGQYKTAGRDRPGEDVVNELEKRRRATVKTALDAARTAGRRRTAGKATAGRRRRA
jgi:hypothetical protein